MIKGSFPDRPRPTHRPFWTFARNLFLCHADRLARARALVRDRGSQFIDAFDEIFRTEGLNILKTPVRTPVANAFAQGWIRSICRELLEQPAGLPRTIIWNQHQLKQLVVDYIAHHTEHRPHRSLRQRSPTEAAEPASTSTISPLRTTRCDGIINEYRNAA